MTDVSIVKGMELWRQSISIQQVERNTETRIIEYIRQSDTDHYEEQGGGREPKTGCKLV